MEKYISKKEKASYGFAAVGSYMVAGITQSYLMYFFTDILIIPSAFVMMLVTTIVLFMPLTGAPTMFKMIFAAVSYIIFGMAYTLTMCLPWVL